MSNMQFYNPQQGGAPIPNNSQQGQGFYGGGSGGQNNYNNGGNRSPVPDYFKNVSPEMINFGINAGQEMINKQRDKWMPGLSGFWLSLKYYFLVSHHIHFPGRYA
jgi:hypothetical protein